jgi:MYXO-CTERM domain-containing protein
VGGYGWKLLLEDEAGEVLADSVDYERALEWKITGLTVGAYTLTALIQDHADHMVTHTIQIHVVEEDGGSGGETETGTGGGESGDDTAGDAEGTAGLEEGGDSEDGDTDGESDSDSQGVVDDTAKGCGCVTGARAPAGAGLLLILGLAGIRRRRSTPYKCA